MAADIGTRTWDQVNRERRRRRRRRRDDQDRGKGTAGEGKREQLPSAAFAVDGSAE